MCCNPRGLQPIKRYGSKMCRKYRISLDPVQAADYLSAAMNGDIDAAAQLEDGHSL